MSHTSPREKLKSQNRRAAICQWLDEGVSLSRAAKEVGISYAHAKQIAEQEGYK